VLKSKQRCAPLTGHTLPELVARLLIGKVGPDLDAQIVFELPNSACQLIETGLETQRSDRSAGSPDVKPCSNGVISYDRPGVGRVPRLSANIIR
jgi:hypothetical protein